FSAPGPSGAFVRLESDGSGRIVTGAQENGTGAVMGLAILAAEELGMQPEQFAITYQDTDTGPYDGGSSGSQTTFNNGRAVVEAAREVRRQLLELAAQALEAAVDDLQLVDGHVGVVGSPDRRVPIAELAATAHGGALRLAPGLQAPHGRRRADDRDDLRRAPGFEWRTTRVEGRRRATDRPDGCRGRQRDRHRNRGARSTPPDDAGTGLASGLDR